MTKHYIASIKSLTRGRIRNFRAKQSAVESKRSLHFDTAGVAKVNKLVYYIFIFGRQFDLTK